MSQSCKGPKQELVQIGQTPQYWKSLEEVHGEMRCAGEFPGGLPPDMPQKPAETTRRDFLALMGFSLAAAGLSGCRAPVQNAVPLLVGSDQMVAGVSRYYATTCGGCASACSLLVKQRDGRPIKIDGNAESPLFGKGTCATGQATVLSLYDDARLRGPKWQAKDVSWDEVDRQIMQGLQSAVSAKGQVVLLSGTVVSPTTKQIIAEWRRRTPNFRHVAYDAISYSALRAAQERSFGRPVIPHYRFDKARVIVSIDADFLGAWLSPVEFARQYSGTRKAEATRSLHIQFEPTLSVTGSNADVRIPVAPSKLGLVAVALLQRIAKKAGADGAPEVSEDLSSAVLEGRRLDAIADELWKHRGESLVVSGVQDVGTQVVVNALNSLLGAIGKTVDLARGSLQRSGDDQALSELISAMERGEIHALFMHGVNPIHDYPDSKRFGAALQKVPLSVSFSDRLDETSTQVQAVCPDHHFLEAWGDAEPVESHFSLAQPLIAPLFDTRSMQESLLKWLGEEPDYYSYLRDYWRKNLFPRQKETQEFEVFWDRSLQAGVVELPSGAPAALTNISVDWRKEAAAIISALRQSAADGDSFEAHFYESVAMRDGRHANNPWLLELPDPISKVTWGNYVAIAPKAADKLGVKNGDILALKVAGFDARLELPAFVQPGQEAHTISIALGYGRTKTGKAGNNVGANAFPLTSIAGGVRAYSAPNAILEKTGRTEKLACTQGHFSMEGRPIVLETTLEELQKPEQAEKEPMPNLWEKRLEGDHAWGLAIDINSCTGCSACVIACQAENNVPVIGKDQVQRERIMHWIRLDHYYSGSEETPVSLHQPMMCQHCQNAPCETVCPVLATTTSSEGLNQQVYNRCIGTRYCANNCPYKVRRFNWYNYTEKSILPFTAGADFHMASDLGRMVLNPDVVVRSRGVMEKCSLCVQRIQLAKNLALQEQRPLADGDIQTACQQACPAEAIVFGDLKDPKSRVSALRADQRHYEVLEDLGTRPNVGYLKKIRNTNEI